MKNQKKIDSQWNTLYKIAGVFSLLSVATIVLSIVTFFIWPPFPEQILDLLYNNKLAGLISLDILYLLAVICTLPLVLALYTSLMDVNKSLAFISLITGILGIFCLIFARPISEMFYLSHYYHSASSEMEKTAIMVTSKVLTEQFKGTSYYFHLFFGDVSFLISSFLMIKSQLFSKTTAWIGIFTNILAFGMFIPEIGPFIGLVFLLGFIPWIILISFTYLKIK